MSKVKVGFFVIIFLASLSFQVKASHALSCAQPQGDPVQNVIDHASHPIWFGRATLLSFNNFTKKGRYKIEETYLTDSQTPLDEIEKVYISDMNLTWGPYQNIKDKSSKFGIGSTNDMFFLFNNDENRWMFGGPGACVFFTEEQWEALKNHEYKIHSKNNGVNNAN